MRHVPKFVSGEPIKNIVFIFHGYGADGDNLIDLAYAWRTELPNTLFLAPDAPTSCESGYGGFQWFSLLDFSQPAMAKLIGEPTKWLTAFVEEQMRKHQISFENVALVGFSQGAAMALQVGLEFAQQDKACAGIVGYSGGLVVPPSQPGVYPPVLLVHGLSDSVWAADASTEAADALQQAGIQVRLELRPGVDHTIDQGGISFGGAFLKEVFENKE